MAMPRLGSLLSFAVLCLLAWPLQSNASALYLGLNVSASNRDLNGNWVNPLDVPFDPWNGSYQSATVTNDQGAGFSSGEGGYGQLAVSASGSGAQRDAGSGGGRAWFTDTVTFTSSSATTVDVLFTVDLSHVAEGTEGPGQASAWWSDSGPDGGWIVNRSGTSGIATALKSYNVGQAVVLFGRMDWGAVVYDQGTGPYFQNVFADASYYMEVLTEGVDYSTGSGSRYAMTSAAPEPASLALLALGLAGLGFSRRKKA